MDFLVLVLLRRTEILPSICRKRVSRILNILVSCLILILHIVLVADVLGLALIVHALDLKARTSLEKQQLPKLLDFRENS